MAMKTVVTLPGQGIGPESRSCPTFPTGQAAR